MMRIKTKETKRRDFEVVITHEELKTIVSNHLQNSVGLKASNGDPVTIKAPMQPALRIIFYTDAANNIMAQGNWHEAID